MVRVGKIIREFKIKPRKKRYRQFKGRDISPIIYEKLKKQKKCSHCKKKFPILEIHHVIPISQGGTNEESNLVALCKNCHLEADQKLGVR